MAVRAATLAELRNIFYVGASSTSNTILTETIASDKVRDLRISLCWFSKAEARRNLWEFACFP